jgi:4-amino-4-deoxy-L-arabinose transferase-like glycosyltransferase
VKECKGSERWVFVWIIIVTGLILFFNLWGRSLENHGYTRYAEVAREMVRSREWVVPHLNGEIFIDKPPLLFWLIALPSSLYGSVTPFLARLPSAFSALISIIILFLWGKRIYGTTQSGLVAGGILLSSYQFFFQARLAKTDMLLCLFILLSLYFFYMGCGENIRKRYLFYSLSFLSIGLGVLTKGPFGLFIPLLIILVYLIKERRWGLWISKEFILGYVILALTILPWIFLFIHRLGLEQSIALVKGTQILSRTAPIYFYFVKIWGEFAPWSVLLPLLFISLWRQRNGLWSREESFFLIWFLVLIILLTLFKYKASRYFLPALPPLALMIGGIWKRRFSSFLIPFLLFIILWHSIEFNWIREDMTFSPGMLMTSELRPIVNESSLTGYRLDESTVEEIDFYLDRVIPILKTAKDLSSQLREGEKSWILMPKETYEEVRSQRDLSMVFVHEFPYKDIKGRGRLVLVSN